jgi:hypothetical protein
MKSVADLVYATAPHVVPAEVAGREDARTWWYYHEGASPFAPEPIEYRGWPESRRMLAQLWVEHGPFDGLLGFSQGAVAVHQLCMEIAAAQAAQRAGAALTWWGPDESAFLERPPKFAILACGFPSRHRQPGVPPAPVGLPSLHISSPQDPTVAPALQRELEAAFAPEGRVWLEHNKGHAMPQQAEGLRVIAAFVAAACPADGAPL